MANPSKTLKGILLAIDKDVKLIKSLGRKSKLDPSDAQTLCRYASTLDAIVKTTEKDKEKAKKDLEKLSTDELIAQYEKENK